MSFLITFQSVLVLFALIVIGFIAGKKNLVSYDGQRDITNLLLYITLPATIVNAMIRKITPESIENIKIIFIIVFLCYIAMYVLSALMSRSMKGLDKPRQDIMLIGAMQANISFMGFPVILTVFGDEILFYAAICHSFLFEFFSWFVAINVLERNVGENKVKLDLKKVFLRPGILAVLVGLTLFTTQYTPPKLVMDLLKILSGATSPVAMILVGVILSRSNIYEALQNKYLYITSAFKLLVFPILILYALKLMPMGFNEVIITTSVIEFAMPTAAYLAMMSQAVKNDAALASQQVFVSSLFSVLTIPLIVFLIGL